MTTANKITLARMALIPIMVIIIYVPIPEEAIFWNLGLKHIIFAALFIVAALTDFLDGYIARKYNQITTFGKFLDPIADKVLVITGMLYLTHFSTPNLFHGISMWMIVVVIFREFVVTGVRILAAEKGTIIAASNLGKIKTALTMIAIIIFMFNHFGLAALKDGYLLGTIFMIAAVIMTAISGIDYVYKNRSVVFESV